MTAADFPPPRSGRFATTRWSLVLAAGGVTDEHSAEALRSLCELYWYPIYAFIRRQGYGASESADLAQEFFLRVLEKNYFHALDPARGRFRGLSVRLGSALPLQRARSRAVVEARRCAAADLARCRDRRGALSTRAARRLTPEKLFDRRWALILLDRTLTRVGRDYADANKAPLFDHLKGFLTGDSSGVRYAEVAKALNMSEGAVKVRRSPPASSFPRRAGRADRRKPCRTRPTSTPKSPTC